MDWLTIVVELFIGGAVGYVLGRITKALVWLLLLLAVLGFLGIIVFGFSPTEYADIFRRLSKPIWDLVKTHKMMIVGFLIGFVVALFK
ncbi:MAG: hypothetical protein QXP96_04770 [Thermoproteota archaeon]